MAFWNYIKRATERLGVGVSDMPLVQQAGWPVMSRGVPTVRRQMLPLATTPQIYAPHLASVVGISGTTGGAYPTGQALMTALNDYIQQQEQNGPNR